MHQQIVAEIDAATTTIVTVSTTTAADTETTPVAIGVRIRIITASMIDTIETPIDVIAAVLTSPTGIIIRGIGAMIQVVFWAG
ncbi:MAG: hypothetical protein JKY29_05475 [Gammaproteobacteria bacterium]|nr:hypothetical protein [Gammaproteobacteria bacterium]